MPKRSYSTSTAMSGALQGPPAKIQKTERSHEENQERAYIAASRRADRSLEARVQSAKMASDIHRKRTGRGLKVTEDIVSREEMYEEIEDDLPRSYKLLAPHLQTGSPEFNNRVNAYLVTHTAMATAAKYHEVNKMFSEAFPRAASFSYPTQNSLFTPPMNKRHSEPSISGSVSPATRHHSVSASSTSHNTDRLMSEGPSGHAPLSYPTTHTSLATTSTDAMKSPSSPCSMSLSDMLDLPLHEQATRRPTSSFTSELPREVKMMANIDMSNPMTMHFFGEGTPEAFTIPDECGGPVSTSISSLNFSDLDNQDGSPPENKFDEAFMTPFRQNLLLPDTYGQFSSPTCAYPGPEVWENLFVDYDRGQ